MGEKGCTDRFRQADGHGHTANTPPPPPTDCMHIHHACTHMHTHALTCTHSRADRQVGWFAGI